MLTELNRLFQMDQQDGKYFTIWYGVYQPSTHTVRYAGAGHPPAIVLPADGSDPVRLTSESIPIGVLEDTTFVTHSYSVPPDSDLLIYSDGAFDLGTARRPALDPRGVRRPVRPHRGHTALDPEDLVKQLRKRSDAGRFDDDCTLVRVSIH